MITTNHKKLTPVLCYQILLSSKPGDFMIVSPYIDSVRFTERIQSK